MALLKTPAEIKILRAGGKKLAEILAQVAAAGGIPSFKNYRIKEARKPFPGSLCISLNDEVVHGIPRPDRFLHDGDLVGIDIGMLWPPTNGLYTDMAVTIGIGSITKEAERLLVVTREALQAGIKAARPGEQIGDIGNAIQKILEREKYGIVRNLAGHGVGHALHEEPLIPNFGRPGTGIKIEEGMVLAIEPMATLGKAKVELADDDWTFRTADGSLAAHFEHTIAVTETGAEILTVV